MSFAGRFGRGPSLVAVLGVLLVASGSAYALGTASGGSITACVKHNGGALYIHHPCAGSDQKLTWAVRGPTGPRGVQGIPGKAGTPAARLFASITASGGVVASSPGVKAYNTGGGVYTVAFPQNLAKCAAVASVGAVPDGGGSTMRIVGFALADLDGNPDQDSLTNLPYDHEVEVETFNANVAPPALANTSFSVAAFC